jgi:hypothetical protein
MCLQDRTRMGLHLRAVAVIVLGGTQPPPDPAEAVADGFDRRIPDLVDRCVAVRLRSTKRKIIPIHCVFLKDVAGSLNDFPTFRGGVIRHPVTGTSAYCSHLI